MRCSASSTPTPDQPRAKPASWASIAARTAASGASAPVPVRCARSIRLLKPSCSSAATRTRLSAPTPGRQPVHALVARRACPRSAARAAAMRSRARRRARCGDAGSATSASSSIAERVVEHERVGLRSARRSCVGDQHGSAPLDVLGQLLADAVVERRRLVAVDQRAPLRARHAPRRRARRCSSSDRSPRWRRSSAGRSTRGSARACARRRRSSRRGRPPRARRRRGVSSSISSGTSSSCRMRSASMSSRNFS